MNARLTILLGAGGVGKTTLAAAYAIALGRTGKRVGLLGIDPSRRLESALGLTLDDRDVPMPDEPNVRAALLSPRQCFLRWTAEATTDDAERARIGENTFFHALSDRLATAIDVLAAVRVAEWAERDPSLTDLVVDTAPGLGAIDFLRRPESLAAFLDGHLIAWLRWVARTNRPGTFGALARGSARRVVGGLAKIAGARLVLELAEFLSLVEIPLEKMLERIKHARAWLASPNTRIVLVTGVRDDAADAARAIHGALASFSMAPAAVVVNRAVPESLGVELSTIALDQLSESARRMIRYARAYAEMQARVITAVRPLATTFVGVREMRGLDELDRLDALAAVGAVLRDRIG